MQKALHEVLETVGRHHRDDPLFKVAIELERIALSVQILATDYRSHLYHSAADIAVAARGVIPIPESYLRPCSSACRW